MVLGVRGVPSKESPDAGISPACFDPEKIRELDIQMLLIRTMIKTKKSVPQKASASPMVIFLLKQLQVSYK